MTSTKDSPLRAYINEINDLPADVLLGRIVLYTITDERVKHSDLVTWFKDLGLDDAYLPAPNKYLDAFKKATSDVKDSYPLSGGRTGHLLCRDVTTAKDYVVRQITREVRDGGKKKLAYDDAITCTFHRPTDPTNQATSRLVVRVNTPNLETHEVAQMMRIAQEIEKRHHSYYQFIDGQKIRSMVRSYLRKLNAIEIKGGVYFVHATRDEELSRLSELVSRLGGGCHMNMIPMVDLERERAFMAQVFEREAAERLREITREATELVANRKSITGAAYAKLKARYDDVLASAIEHMDTLQITQDVTGAAAEVALKAIANLQEKMLDD